MENMTTLDQSAILAEATELIEQPYGAVIIQKLTKVMEQAVKQ